MEKERRFYKVVLKGTYKVVPDSTFSVRCLAENEEEAKETAFRNQLQSGVWKKIETVRVESEF